MSKPTRTRTRATARPALDPLEVRPGRPLYRQAQDAIVNAIESGRFRPGDRLPSTKDLSGQLGVSLVTAHRALQELVGSGVLDRTQGRGTFVIDPALRAVPRHRLGVVMQPDASMADYYHSILFEGMRQAAEKAHAELSVGRLTHEGRLECDAYLAINPVDANLRELAERLRPEQRLAVVGARSTHAEIPHFDVDNADLTRRAVDHLVGLGHRRIAFVGGAEELSNTRDRHIGFDAALRDLGLDAAACPVIAAAGWQFDDAEREGMNALLRRKDRPTAVFAAGYYLALDVYEAAAAVGLRVPDDLSVVGTDNPGSCAYLSPGLTTMAQPLPELGAAAVEAMVAWLRDPDAAHPDSVVLPASLVARDSTARL